MQLENEKHPGQESQRFAQATQLPSLNLMQIVFSESQTHAFPNMSGHCLKHLNRSYNVGSMNSELLPFKASQVSRLPLLTALQGSCPQLPLQLPKPVLLIPVVLDQVASPDGCTLVLLESLRYCVSWEEFLYLWPH